MVALACENNAIENEYLAKVAERAQVEYRGGNVLRLMQPDVYRKWAARDRQYAQEHLDDAVRQHSTTNS